MDISQSLKGKKSELTKPERRQVMLALKERALDGDVDAAVGLSNFELADVTRKRLEMDLDRVA